jgi:hypothetical protein
MFNDEIRKKKVQLYERIQNKKLQLKEWGSKLNFIFYWRVKLKRKINLKRKKNNQKNEDQN